MNRFFIEPDIARAKTLHKDFYQDPMVNEAAKELIFAGSWQFAGDAPTIVRGGNAAPFSFLPGWLDEPLLLTVDKEDQWKVLSNTCTHRGNKIVEHACRLSHLRCRYHGRNFSLDGQFLSMPEFKEVKDFPSAADNLSTLPLFRWGNWLFTSLQDHQPENYFSEMMARMAWLPVEDFVFKPELSSEFPVAAHWALYCENYLEGFHIPFVHASLNAKIDFGNYTTELFTWSNLQLGIAKEAEDCFDLPPASSDFGKKVAAYYFFVFPNMMFNFYPWGLSVNIVRPETNASCRVQFLTFLWKPENYDTGAGSGLDAVEHEDEEVVENVQRGIRSRFYQHGRYSVTREQGTHHFHRMIAEKLKNLKD